MPPIKLTTVVLPGGKIEVKDSRLIEGVQVHLVCTEVTDSNGATADSEARSLLDLVKRGHSKGPLFTSPAELDQALESERRAWD